MIDMIRRGFLPAAVILCLCGATAVFAEEGSDSIPTTGTLYDSLINKAYACQREYLDASSSIGQEVVTLKELLGKVLEKSAAETDTIMAMADTVFIALVSQEEVRQAFKTKITEDAKITIDTVNSRLALSRENLNRSLESATLVTRELLAAIGRLPAEFKGLNARKIPAVKSALEKANGWVNQVIASVPVNIEEVDAAIGAVKGLVE